MGWVVIRMKKLGRLHTRTCLRGDYGDVPLQTGTVAIENADYCCTWKIAKDTLLHQLEKKVYASEAIIRITVSSRMGTVKDDETTDDIIDTYTKKAVNCGYEATVLPIGCWRVGDDDDDIKRQRENKSMPAFAYAPRMVNLFFLLTTPCLSDKANLLKTRAKKLHLNERQSV